MRTAEPIIAIYEASDGYRLHYRLWRPEGTPRARIIALHGIQSHGGWFTESSRRLADAGFEVRFLDRRGSGLNAIDRGHAAHHERLLNDVVQMLVAARSDPLQRVPCADPRGRGPGEGAVATDVPVCLMGISWGARLAVAVAARRPDLVSALALLYPGLYPKIGPTLGQRLALALARKTPIGRWNTVAHRHVPIPLADPALFTANAERQAFIAADPLALRHVTVAFLLAGRALDRAARAAPERLAMPVLMMLAGRDLIINNRAARRWFARLPNSDRSRLIEYPNAHHTLEFEPDPELFFADLVAGMQTLAAAGCSENDAPHSEKLAAGASPRRGRPP